jgi:GntR family histidine utilization transcriptional repressor
MKSTLSQPAPRTGPKAARAARPEAAAPDQGGLRYQRIKHYVLAQIHGGVWKEGDLIAGEQALAQQFGVSRMTVHRALRELSDEQIVERRQGSGTYVAQQKYYASLVEIRNIADEIAARGHQHRSELHKLERVRLGRALAAPPTTRWWFTLRTVRPFRWKTAMSTPPWRPTTWRRTLPRKRPMPI